MEILEVIFKGLFCICITVAIVFYLVFVTVTISDTNIKVTEIHHHLGLDTVHSDTTVYTNEGDTIRFNIMLK